MPLTTRRATPTRRRTNAAQRISCSGCLLRLLFTSFALLAGVLFTVWVIYQVRLPDRTPLSRPLFQGVTYERVIWNDPRPVVWHLIHADLRVPGVRLFTTPGNLAPTPPALEFSARTTSAFMREFGVQVAVNGSFFDPFRAGDLNVNALWDYYPQVGDPVNALGLVISDGQVYSPEIYIPAFCAGAGWAQIGSLSCPAETQQALAGNTWFLQHGVLLQPDPNPELQPRTVVAVDATGQQVWLLVVDGRQDGYSEGVTLHEAATFLLGYGASDALNLDGGGSSTLAVQTWWGAAVFNAPMHTRIPTRERPVANHLGIYALPLD